jgi:hypothetical protein
VPTFWRVLDDAPLFDPETLTAAPNPQSTRRRWGRGEYNSTHKSCPTEWQAKWLQGHMAAADYGPADLSCATGLHTPAALNAFLAAAATHGFAAPWPDDVLVAVGELDGTCAWETREQAWYYVLGKLPDQAIEDCTITDEKLDLSSVVEFTGDDLGVAIPEGQGQGGGRQVRVTHPGVIKPARQFAQENDFVIPIASNEINLDVPGEDDMEGG